MVQTEVPSLVQGPAPHGTLWHSGKQEAKGTRSRSLDLPGKGSHGPLVGNTLGEISPFSHITTCPQSLLISAAEADILLTLLWPEEHFPYGNPWWFKISLAESSHVRFCPWLHLPLSNGEKKTPQILISLNHLTPRRCLAAEDRGKPGLPSSSWLGALHSHPHPHCPTPLCQVSPKGYTGTWKWYLKGAERKRPIWRPTPFVPRLPSLNTAWMSFFNTQKPDEMQVISLWLWQDYYV